MWQTKERENEKKNSDKRKFIVFQIFPSLLHMHWYWKRFIHIHPHFDCFFPLPITAPPKVSSHLSSLSLSILIFRSKTECRRQTKKTKKNKEQKKRKTHHPHPNLSFHTSSSQLNHKLPFLSLLSLTHSLSKSTLTSHKYTISHPSDKNSFPLPFSLLQLYHASHHHSNFHPTQPKRSTQLASLFQTPSPYSHFLTCEPLILPPVTPKHTFPTFFLFPPPHTKLFQQARCIRVIFTLHHCQTTSQIQSTNYTQDSSRRQ